jgi:hypothetical protein
MRPCTLTSFSGQKQNLLMVGDSHTGDFGGAFTEYLNINQFNGSMLSMLGCGYLSQLKDKPSNTSCSQSRALLFELAQKKIFTTLLLVSAGELHTTAEVTEFKVLVKGLLDTGAEVILFEPRMRLKYDPKKAGVLQQNSRNMVILFEPELSKDWDSALTELKEYKNFKVFDQAKVLLDAGCGRVACFDGHTPNRHLIYRDPTHLTDFGARAVLTSFNAWYRPTSQP